MLLIQLVVVLIVLGLLLYIVESLLPIDANIKLVIRIVILLAVILWLLSAFNLIPGGNLRLSWLKHGRWNGSTMTTLRTWASPGRCSSGGSYG